MHVEYGVLDRGLCMMECTCVLPHHIYSYWHFNTSACCNVGKRYPPHVLMNCCIFQLWCRLGAIQLRVGLQSTIGAHQEK